MNFNFNSKCILTIEMKLFVEACLSISNIFVYANNDMCIFTSNNILRIVVILWPMQSGKQKCYFAISLEF